MNIQELRKYKARKYQARQHIARQLGTAKLASILITAALLTGCLESADAPGGGLGTADNSAPQISGDPQYVAVMGKPYTFVPSSFDDDGDALRFSIRNQPAWADFDPATGRLEGTPQFGDSGTYDDIVISVSDGLATTSMAAFSIAISRDELGSVTLEWVPPERNIDGSYAGDLAGYVIYWGTEPGNYDQQQRIDNVGLTAYVVDNLQPATYYFAATAFNSAGVESGFSNEVERSVIVN